MAAKEASVSGTQVTFTPMVDLSRDARWGRIMESCGEDPYLNSVMGAAQVKGFQGDDISKPDRHIRRILGSKYLGCSESEIVPIYEAFDIVAEIAAELGKPVAEVDYILWSYCANGYGEVCTLNKPKCEKCVVKEYCKKECQL